MTDSLSYNEMRRSDSIAKFPGAESGEKVVAKLNTLFGSRDIVVTYPRPHPTDIDNRDKDEMVRYLEARIEAMKARIHELEGRVER